jgi:adenylate cyclase
LDYFSGGRSRVVGRSTPIKIYELLGKKGDIQESLIKVLPFYKKGLTNYQNREWAEAKIYFKNALKENHDDGPSKTYLERSLKLLDPPPAEDWNGVYNLTKQ